MSQAKDSSELKTLGDNESVESLHERIRNLEHLNKVANASPQGFPITHYNVYVNGMPVLSPESLQDALAHAALMRLESVRNGNGFPAIKITKRVVRHPMRNDSVTEEEVA
jgi:hypothetical protein